MDIQNNDPSPHDVRRISVESLIGPRAIVRYFRGEPVRDLTRRRIETTLDRLGIPRYGR